MKKYLKCPPLGHSLQRYMRFSGKVVLLFVAEVTVGIVIALTSTKAKTLVMAPAAAAGGGGGGGQARVGGGRFDL